VHSLYLRIFVLFWVAMASIVGASIATTFAIAAREYGTPPDFQRRPSVAIQASEILGRDGIGALKTWLVDNKNQVPDRDVYIVAPDGHDILGRHLPESATRRLEYFAHEWAGAGEAHGGTGSEPGNFRPPRAAPQLVAPDGTLYTFISVPRRPSIFGALSLPAISLTILVIALIVSALASWWLADHLATPIRRIQAGARSVASANLDVRVSAGLEQRRDEVAVLARDFDAMADQLRANRRATTQLLRDVSHELRSPLARMRVALGLARQPPADVVRQLDRLEREIERLDQLIGQVLKLARLQGAEESFVREPVDLDEIIEEVVHDANFEGAVKRCSVSLAGAAQVAVLGSRELLRSAIENVLRNAVRYNPGDGQIDVSVMRRAPGLEILIRDHGPGVPQTELTRIFEPFYRVAESRDRDSGGEGIGLAITAQVMRAHGGDATASNAPGGGLAVRLSLPEAAFAV
jgi:two-component system OmpR family sensor kinase